MIDFKYDEYAYAEHIIESGFSSQLSNELRIVATYYRRIFDYKQVEVKAKLTELCREHINSFHVGNYYKAINKAISVAFKDNARLVKIREIPIYQKELDYINQPDLSTNEKRVLFALLVMHKIKKERYRQVYQKESQSNVYFAKNARFTEIKKLSNIPQSLDIDLDVFYSLTLKGYINPLYNGNIQLLFLDKCSSSENLVAMISDFRNLGYRFEVLTGNSKYIVCQHCGMPCLKRNNSAIYCSEDCCLQAKQGQSC